MKRTILMSVLCCLLAVLLPLSAMAENPAYTLLSKAYEEGKTLETTIRVEPGAGLTTEKALLDLLYAVNLRLSVRNDNSGALTFIINELDKTSGLPTGVADEVLTLALRTSDEGLFVGSELLGDQPIFLSNEDLSSVLTQATQSLGMSVNLPTTVTSVTTLPDAAPAESDSLMDALNAKKEEKALTDEELLQQLTNSFGGDETLAKAVVAMKNRAVVSDVDIQADDHDPAVKKVELTLTQDDLLVIVSSEYFRKQMIQSLTLQKQDDPEKTADESIADAKAILSRSEVSLPIVVLKDAEGGVVCIECLSTGHIAMQDSDTTEYNDITMPVRYTRLTAEVGKTYNLSVIGNNLKDGAEEPAVYIFATLFHGADAALAGKLECGEYTDGAKDEPEFQCDLSYLWTGAQAKGELRMVADNKEGAVLALTQDLSETSLTNALAVYLLKDGVTAAEPMLTLHADVAITDAHVALDALATATPDTSVKIAQMSSDEMSTYLGTLQANLINLSATMISKLPSSLSTALMQLLTGGM